MQVHIGTSSPVTMSPQETGEVVKKHLGARSGVALKQVTINEETGEIELQVYSGAKVRFCPQKIGMGYDVFVS